MYVHAKDGSRSRCRIPLRPHEAQEEMSAIGIGPVIVGATASVWCFARIEVAAVHTRSLLALAMETLYRGGGPSAISTSPGRQTHAELAMRQSARFEAICLQDRLGRG
jgi:hypothetical protein